MAFNLILNKLSKTRAFLREQLDKIITRGALDKELLAELEAVLIQADLGVQTANAIIKEVEKVKAKNKEEVYSSARNTILNILKKNSASKNLAENREGPAVILILGVNGTGKTTTIAKLAYRLRNEKKKVLLAAGDTFRAAAIEQLETLAGRVGVDIIKNVYKADPSAVAYDALKSAISRKMDYLIIDTAGRFHNKADLMDEIKKINRTMQKHYPGSPHEKILVLDSTTGQNGLIQAREFHEALGLTGIIITKLDGTAKGGIIVNIQSELNIPIKFVGIGQELSDLIPFDPVAYVNAIL